MHAKPKAPSASSRGSGISRESRLRNLTLRQLRLFEAVASHLNYSRAAEQMSVTQPAVSMQLQQLEKDLGLQLLVKQGRRITRNAVVPAQDGDDFGQRRPVQAVELRLRGLVAVIGQEGRIGRPHHAQAIGQRAVEVEQQAAARGHAASLRQT